MDVTERAKAAGNNVASPAGIRENGQGCGDSAILKVVD